MICMNEQHDFWNEIELWNHVMTFLTVQFWNNILDRKINQFVQNMWMNWCNYNLNNVILCIILTTDKIDKGLISDKIKLIQ